MKLDLYSNFLDYGLHFSFRIKTEVGKEFTHDAFSLHKRAYNKPYAYKTCHRHSIFTVQLILLSTEQFFSGLSLINIYCRK